VNEQVTVTMQVRYDNATHYEGDNDINGRTVAGNPFPESVDTGSTIGV